MSWSPKFFLTVSVFCLLVLLGHYVDQIESRAYFVFGDSLVDNGNNNYLLTSARANSPPYGIDLPTGRPTGRFSNGLNLADIIGKKVGAKPLLPYLSPESTGNRLLVGANFASAGVGILNDTGIQFLNIMRISTQLQNFKQYQDQISALVGKTRAQHLVNQAVILIALGGNDFVNNYFLLTYSARSFQFTLPDYVNYLMQEYRKILMRLYELGGRRVIVPGVGALGCVPAVIASRGLDGECVAELQQASKLFNNQLVKLLQGLNKQLKSDIFVASNGYEMEMDIIKNPKAFGFETSNVACCGQGPFNGLGRCTPLSRLCSNRTQQFFWDAYHPTERAIRLLSKQIMKGSDKYMSPMNLSTIIALDL